MDVSDGFIGDLTKMLKLEALGASLVVTDLPLSQAVRAALAHEPSLCAKALTGGDDYEVICCVPSDQGRRLRGGGGAGRCARDGRRHRRSGPGRHAARR